ncbi:MAG: nucleotidyltransferase [Anaerocolumna sp.]|jgi:hypothetical protein|nr:nucleotidyltransferase [Anaerocolumna sp.]
MVNTEAELKNRYLQAMNDFVDNIKDDPNVIAVIMCGSLAYDQIWEKSDIDTKVIIRDQSIKNKSYCITQDQIIINVDIITRSDFKRSMEKSLGGSINQSILAKGQMVYTVDESLKEFFEENKIIGENDTNKMIFYMATELVNIMDKCKKWLFVKKDYLYTQFYLLKAVDCIARIEVLAAGESPNREVIQRALEVNPDVIIPFYQEALSHHFNEEELLKAIDFIDSYLDSRLDIIAQPVKDFMKDEEIKTVTILAKHFEASGHYIVAIFEFLADKGILERVSQNIRITPKSRLSVEELGFLYLA